MTNQIWVFDQGDGALDYPELGFIAQPNALLSATAAPDGRWSLNGDQGAAETVTRYTIGSDPSYVEPGDQHILAWSDPDNAYVPESAANLLASDAWSSVLSATIAQTKVWAKNPDNLVTGAVTLDASDLVTSAVVKWPDGLPGVLTITSRQATTNAVLGYTVTRVDGGTTTTYTQPTITRNSNGAATNVPEIVVS